MSRIIKLIDEIEEFFDNCKTSVLSRGKVLVARDELSEMLTELRIKTPDEIVKAKALLEKEEQIVSDAKVKAEQIIEEANQKTKELVSESEIMQEAYAQAENIVSQATYEANEMRIGAVKYVEDMLNSLEELMREVMGETQGKYEAYIASTNRQIQIINDNRNELLSQLKDVDNSTVSNEEPAQE